MAKKGQSKFMKELSSWAKPTKGIVFTPGTAVYRVANTAFRHPYITLAATLAGGVKRSRHLRRRKFYESPLAGQRLKKNGKWML